jgi:hypothetical protein
MDVNVEGGGGGGRRMTAERRPSPFHFVCVGLSGCWLAHWLLGGKGGRLSAAAALGSGHFHFLIPISTFSRAFWPPFSQNSKSNNCIVEPK